MSFVPAAPHPEGDFAPAEEPPCEEHIRDPDHVIRVQVREEQGMDVV